MSSNKFVIRIRMTREIVFNNTDREKFEVKKSCGGIMELIHRRSCHLVRKTQRYQLASLDCKEGRS
jgi:hypothetical protein